MGVDYIARKSAKKRKKKERQAVGKDGAAQRERRRKKIRRLCQGVCYKAPELTEEDKRWSDPEYGDAVAPDSDVEEAVARANSHRDASTSGATTSKTKEDTIDKRKARTKKNKRNRDGDDVSAKLPTLSTSVQLLDPAVLAHNARQAALRKLPAGAKADALERFPPLLQACMLTLHHVEPTPVQERCWPPAIEGRDVQSIAEPGSGKTLAYLLPGLVRLQVVGGHSAASKPKGPVMVVLLPTRELAQQVAAQCRAIRAVTGLRVACVFGGVPREEQAALLSSKCPHVLVATPGRALDLVDGGKLKLQGHVQYLVLDEADKMLSLGFKTQLDRLYSMLLQPYNEAAAAAAPSKATVAAGKAARETVAAAAAAALSTEGGPYGSNSPAVALAATVGGYTGGRGAVRKQRPQVLLFSATMPSDVNAAAAQWLLRPEVVRVSASGANAISRTVTQVVHVCAEHKKADKLLKHLARVRESVLPGSRNAPRVLVFANRVKTVRFLTATLAKEGYKVAQLHGQRSQAERNQAMADFRSGKAQVLVATDVAARGLDIRALPYVVNYDFPARLETYVHRVGRTGRLAAYGHAFSFFTRNLAPLAPALLELLQANDQAVDPNLAALATAWKVAEEKLGGKGAAAVAAAAARSTDGTAAVDGEDDGDGEDDDEGDGAGGSGGNKSFSLAEEILLAAEDLMEGLGPRDARAIAALVRKRLTRKEYQDEQAMEEGADGGEGEEIERGIKKKKRQGCGELEMAAMKEVAAVQGKKGKKARMAVAAAAAAAPGDTQLVYMSKEQQRRAMQRKQEKQREQSNGKGTCSAAYVPVPTFKGAMPGYAFKKGPLGLGYYLDQKEQQRQKALGAQQEFSPKDEVQPTVVAAAAQLGKGKGKAAASVATVALAFDAAAARGETSRKKVAAASPWGLPTRNKPIIPVRHSDFLSDSDDDGGGGRNGSDSSELDPNLNWAMDSDSSEEDAVPFRTSTAVIGGVKKAVLDTRPGAKQPAANALKSDGRDAGDDDGGDSGSEGGDEPRLEGERAVAKRRFKALPGRLRKKLRKAASPSVRGQTAGRLQRPEGPIGKKKDASIGNR